MTNLDLIDWRLVASSALWISGLSVLLAALSFAGYSAPQRELRARDVLLWPSYQAALCGGLALFCLGLAGAAGAWWQQLPCAALAAAFTYRTWTAWRKRAGPRVHPQFLPQPPGVWPQ